jgi:hypothetical protein
MSEEEKQPDPAAAEKAAETWPVLAYPTQLDVIEKLVYLAGPVKLIEEQAAKFFVTADGKEVSKITDDAAFDRAAIFALDCNTVEKRIDTRRTKIVTPANTFVKLVNGTLNPYITRINTVRKKVTDAAHVYKKAKDEAARVKAEEERKAREADALERAQRLQDSGNVEAANQLLEIAATAPKPKTTSMQVGGGGGGGGGSAFERGRWTGVVMDKASVLKAAIAGRFPMDAITISQATLNEKAREIAKETVIDGIKITRAESLGLRRS